MGLLSWLLGSTPQNLDNAVKAVRSQFEGAYTITLVVANATESGIEVHSSQELDRSLKERIESVAQPFTVTYLVSAGVIPAGNCCGTDDGGCEVGAADTVADAVEAVAAIGMTNSVDTGSSYSAPADTGSSYSTPADSGGSSWSSSGSSGYSSGSSYSDSGSSSSSSWSSSSSDSGYSSSSSYDSGSSFSSSDSGGGW